MYCSKCGKQIDDSAVVCPNCGNAINSATQVTEDAPCLGFAILGFIIPLVGLILYLVYEGKQPLKAKSAGKGALIGFITGVVLTIIIIVSALLFTFNITNKIIEGSTDETITGIYTQIENWMDDDTTEILREDLDVQFGELEITGSEMNPEAHFDVTVTNKSNDRDAYFITVEVIDSEGGTLDNCRMKTDVLSPGQTMHIQATIGIEQNEIDDYQNATLHVLNIEEVDD